MMLMTQQITPTRHMPIVPSAIASTLTSLGSSTGAAVAGAGVVGGDVGVAICAGWLNVTTLVFEYVLDETFEVTFDCISATTVELVSFSTISSLAGLLSIVESGGTVMMYSTLTLPTLRRRRDSLRRRAQ